MIAGAERMFVTTDRAVPAPTEAERQAMILALEWAETKRWLERMASIAEQATNPDPLQ